jgi:hypothetical protein
MNLFGFTCLALAAQTSAQQTINKVGIKSLSDLVAGFAEADNNPANTYNLYLGWVQDANGNTVPFRPVNPITLTKGHVNLYGSNTHLYPDRYVFDGGKAYRLFLVDAATGYKPTLTLSGLTVQNGYTRDYGAGLLAKNAEDIQIYWCRFLKNKSGLRGAGMTIYNTRNFYMMHSEVAENTNYQYSGCGNGVEGAGGGLYLGNTTSELAYAAIHWSTIYNDTACRGAGLYANGEIQLLMSENSIIDNHATQLGGGLFLDQSSAYSQLTFNTVTGNHAGSRMEYTAGRPHTGGGLVFANYTGQKNWQGNVIASNHIDFPQRGTGIPTYRTDDCYTLAGSANGNPYNNFVGYLSNCSQLGTAGSWGIGSDLNPADPKLNGPWAGKANGNGFPMTVYVPWPDSPVRGNFFNGGPGRTCDWADQLDKARPNDRCDVGAIQY